MTSTFKTLKWVGGALMLVLLTAISITGALAYDATADAAPEPVALSPVLSHTITEHNLIAGNRSIISHPAMNGDASAMLFVSPNNTPGGQPVATFEGQVGVQFNFDVDRWMLVGIGDTLAVGHTFNVLYEAPGDNTVLHFDLNPVVGATALNHPAINNNESANILVTPRVSDTFNNHPVALQYNGENGTWYIINQDDEPMPDNVFFNVRIRSHASETVKAFGFGELLTEDGRGVIISHERLNGNENAMVWFTAQTTEVEVEIEYPLTASYNHGLARWVVKRADGVGDMAGVMIHAHLAPVVLGSTYELLSNTSFEAQSEVDPKVASNWSTNAVNKAKLQRNKPQKSKFFSSEGDYTYQFKGKDGFKSVLKQKVTFDAPVDDDQFILSASVRAKNLTGGAKIIARLDTESGEKIKIRLDKDQLNSGTYDHTVFTNESTFISDPIVSARVKIIMNGTSGKFWVDQVSIRYSSLGLAPSPDGEAAPLPLPPAPPAD